MKSDDGSGIGSRLDEFRWDYEPANTERRFFLKPVGAFFGTFRWEGRGGQFPVPEDQVEPSAPDDS